MDIREIEISPHPWYGPCDSLGFGSGCAECQKVIFTLHNELTAERCRVKVVNIKWKKALK